MTLSVIIDAVRNLLGKPAPEPIDTDALLDKLAAENPKLHVRTSVIDLMVALGFPYTTLQERRELAAELGVTGDVGTAETNAAMHRALLERVAANGGMVPDNLT